ncbi:hypothetical protein [Caudoviricetes sp.]|nr:hypothetical protein [Caudoviricetes sp.]
MFDMEEPLLYNTSQDVINDAVVEHYLNQPQIVKMDEQKPVNDTKCQHETLVPDPDDRIGDAIYYGCANQKCGRGFYLREK